MAQHSILGPSGAHRWMRCAGSPAAEEPFRADDKGSVFAEEGTAAHELASWALEGNKDCLSFVGRITENRFVVKPDMAADVQTYVDQVRAYAADHSLFVEQEISLEHITGEPGAMGTSDAIIINPDAKEIQVHDLKFGRGVTVHPMNGDGSPNEQMALYALGALEAFGDFCDLETVLLVIHQPRLGHLSEHRMTIAELKEFGELAKAKGALAWAIYTSNPNDPNYGLNPEFLIPGDKQCKFCKAKSTCPALRAQALRTVLDDFDDVSEPQPDVAAVQKAIAKIETCDDDHLDRVYPILELIEDWGRSVLARIEKRMHDGAVFKNCKLVQGKRGSRAWIDSAAAEAAMKSMRLKQEEMYDFKLISPTSADKLLSKENPKRWAKLLGLITQSEGRPSIAPITDKRPALVVQSPSDDFTHQDDASDLIG